MCGLFGFVAAAGKTVDLRRLEAVGLDQVARGRDAWGMAWLDSAGRIAAYRQPGRLTDYRPLLALARDAVLVVGHTRLATQGPPEDQINNHPHPTDGGWLCHNGQVRQSERLAGQRLLPLISDCDSEVLARLIEAEDGTLLRRCAAAAEIAASPPLALLGVWSRPGRVVSVRDGNPLWMSENRDGWYFGSLSAALPNGAEMLPDREAVEWHVGSGPVRRRALRRRRVKPSARMRLANAGRLFA